MTKSVTNRLNEIIVRTIVSISQIASTAKNEPDLPPSPGDAPATPPAEIIRRAWSAIVRWQRWLDDNRAGMADGDIFAHEESIRFAKGIVKSWRLRDATRPRGQIEPNPARSPQSS